MRLMNIYWSLGLMNTKPLIVTSANEQKDSREVLHGRKRGVSDRVVTYPMGQGSQINQPQHLGLHRKKEGEHKCIGGSLSAINT